MHFWYKKVWCGNTPWSQWKKYAHFHVISNIRKGQRSVLTLSTNKGLYDTTSNTNANCLNKIACQLTRVLISVVKHELQQYCIRRNYFIPFIQPDDSFHCRSWTSTSSAKQAVRCAKMVHGLLSDKLTLCIILFIIKRSFSASATDGVSGDPLCRCVIASRPRLHDFLQTVEECNG